MIPLLVALVVAGSAESPIVSTELSGHCETSAVAVYASGFVHFQTSNSCGTARETFTASLRRVSGADLEKLEVAISRARFDALPESIEPDPKVVSTEEDVFSIRVWQKRVARTVRAFGLDRAQDKDAAKRFQAFWAAITQLGQANEK